MAIGPKEQQLRAQREARAKTAARPPVTAKLRDAVTVKSNVTVTPPTSNVTKRAKPAGSGRRKAYTSGAERQKAYRERRRAKA